MANPKVEVAIKNCCLGTGEGPHWDVPSQSLYYVDIENGGIVNWDYNTGKSNRIDLDGTVGFVTPCDKGGVITGFKQSIVRLDLSTKEMTELGSVEKGEETRFNDGKCDASGRVWAGTMGFEGDVPGVVPKGKGSLYSMGEDGNIVKHVGDIDISNGMDWTDDNRIMYYIDSVPRKVYAFDFDITEGKLSNQRTVVEFGPDTMKTFGLPDGMCIDTEGKIWVACFSSSRVCRFDPETGKSLQHVELPATNITSVCFGGKNMDEMFVTCSRTNVQNLDSQPLAGSIFKVTGHGAKGRQMYNFKY